MPKNGDGCLAKTFLNHKIFDFVKKKIVDFRDIKFNERNSANEIKNNQNTVVNLQLNQIVGVNDPDGREENGEQKSVGKEETQFKIQISHMSI